MFKGLEDEKAQYVFYHRPLRPFFLDIQGSVRTNSSSTIYFLKRVDLAEPQ